MLGAAAEDVLADVFDVELGSLGGDSGFGMFLGLGVRVAVAPWKAFFAVGIDGKLGGRVRLVAKCGVEEWLLAGRILHIKLIVSVG